ncbi:TPA: hypothetical protein JLJ01_003703 [Escherichia coli]|nr:hypothetical protein [Escherichia coli]
MATTTKDMVEVASAYTLIIHRLIANNVNTTTPESEVKNNVIGALRALQECADLAGDYAARMVIDDVIKDIDSGKPLKAFV